MSLSLSLVRNLLSSKGYRNKHQFVSPFLNSFLGQNLQPVLDFEQDLFVRNKRSENEFKVRINEEDLELCSTLHLPSKEWFRWLNMYIQLYSTELKLALPLVSLSFLQLLSLDSLLLYFPDLVVILDRFVRFFSFPQLFSQPSAKNMPMKLAGGCFLVCFLHFLPLKTHSQLSLLYYKLAADINWGSKLTAAFGREIFKRQEI